MPLKKSNKIGVLSDGIAPFHTGGMQSHTRNLICDLCETFEKVYLVLPRNQELKKAQQVLNLYSIEVRSKLNVILVDRPSARVKIPGGYVIEEIALSKLLNQALSALKEDLDFIYAQGFTGWNKEFRIAPVLTHLHGYEFVQKTPGTVYSAKSKFLGFFFRILIKRSDYLISLGGKITDFIKKLGVDKSKIIEHLNGLDETPGDFSRKEFNKEKQFIFVARNEKRKGYTKLISAWSAYKGQGHLHVVGDFNPIEGAENVTFYGEIKNKEELTVLYKNSDFIILPSYAEGMPMVLLEAAQFASIPICTNVGAISSYFSSKEALWIEIGSSQSLAYALAIADKLSKSKMQEMRKSFSSKSDEFTREACMLAFRNRLKSLGLS